MPLRDRLNDFASATSMHGASKSVLSEHPVRRRLWMLLLITAWTVLIWQLTLLGLRYLSYPKRVTVTVEHEGVPFPSITLFYMRTLNAYTLQRLADAYKGDNAWLGNKSSAQASTEFIKFAMTLSKLIDTVQMIDHRPSSFDYEGNKRVFELTSSKTIGANFPQDAVRKAANQIDKFVALCKFENMNCNISENFAEIFSSTFYTCFTYTSSEIKEHRRSGIYPAMPEGRELGWSSVLFSGSGILKDIAMDEFDRAIPGIFDRQSTSSGGQGVRVIIHPPDTIPLPETEGYDVPPGHSASFNIRPRLTQLMDKPYRQCTRVNPFDSSLGYERYRKNECMDMCKQTTILEKCGCIDSYLPNWKTKLDIYNNANVSNGESNFTDAANITEKQEFCRHISFNKSADKTAQFENDKSILYEFITGVKCSEQATLELYNNITLLESCGCNAPCSEFSYDVSYSLSTWPSTKLEAPMAFMDILTGMGFMGRLVESCGSEEESRAYYDYLMSQASTALRDFVRINVLASDSSVIQTVESPDYLPFQLISDVGGQRDLDRCVNTDFVRIL